LVLLIVLSGYSGLGAALAQTNRDVSGALPHGSHDGFGMVAAAVRVVKEHDSGH
jgi:hypothetical protein